MTTEAAEYLSPEWYALRRQGVAASEIAAVLGLSPWVSPFDLWWHKKTGEDSQPESGAMRRGKRREAAVLADFADAHPEFRVVPQTLPWRNADRPWQLCTPDAVAFDGNPSCDCGATADPDLVCACLDDPVAVVEAKTAGTRDGWGEEGTDDIPVYYRCQVLWQMDTLDLRAAYVPVWFGDDYREYLVEWHEPDVLLMREAAEDFLASLAADTPPDVDSHPATLRRLKRIHPDLDDTTTEVPATLVRQYLRAKALRDRAQDRMRLAEARIRNLAGPAARIAWHDGDRVRTFSHTISELPERTQTVRAHRRDVINFPRKETP